MSRIPVTFGDQVGARSRGVSVAQHIVLVSPTYPSNDRTSYRDRCALRVDSDVATIRAAGSRVRARTNSSYGSARPTV